MKRSHHIILVAALFGAACIAACGAASAPPVDLPAPVVGRVTVGAPDASGKSTITGTPGAVEGGAIVMATNERLAGTASLLWKISDTLMPAAYAQSLPAICSLLGHACAVALADGSFVLIIDAVIGDSITLVLIDASGAEISARISVIIPNITAGADMLNCTGKTVDGTLVDLVDAGGTPITLFEGNGVVTNRLVVGSVDVQLPGCYAKSLTLTPIELGIVRVVTVSSDDKLVWTGVGGSSGPESFAFFTLDVTPLAVASIGQPDYVALLYKTASGLLNVGKFSVVDGAILASLELPINSDGFEVFKTFGPFADSAYLGMVIAREPVTGVYNTVLFNAETYANITGGPAGFISLTELISSIQPLAVADAAFLSTEQFSGNVYIALADNGVGGLLLVSLSDAINGVISIDMKLGIYTSVETSYFGKRQDSAEPIRPKKVVFGYPLRVSVPLKLPTAYTITDTTRTWRVSDILGAHSSSLLTVSGLAAPVALAIADDGRSSMFIGDDGLKTAVDASSMLGL